MDPNKLCPGCMNELNGDFCPVCGYNRKNAQDNGHALKPFTILGGKYLVGNVIGEGGFGITYIGFDLNLELKIAVKEFYPNGFVTRESENTSNVTGYTTNDPAQYQKWKDSFIREARNLARFSNLQGIVHVRDFFQENNTAYIVMEYVEGETLKDYLKKRVSPMSVRETLDMMEPVIRSLSKVHTGGIIHRDISPDNIMIQKSGEIKLIDFGAAREFDSGDEKSMSVLLKPGYAPEEQYRSKGEQGPWTDVYALCATMYRCITGVKPEESMERIRSDELKKPSELGISITPDVEKVLLSGMEVFAEKRIRSMDDLHRSLYGTNYSSVGSNAGTVPPAEPKPSVFPGGGEKRGMPFGKTGRPDKKIMIIAAAALLAVVFLIVIATILGRSKDRWGMAEVLNDEEFDKNASGTGKKKDHFKNRKEAPIGEIYGMYLAERMRTRDTEAIEEIELYDINKDNITDIAVLWKGNDNEMKEEIYSIRDGDAICIFTADVDEYNLWIAEDRSGDTLCRVTDNKNRIYIVHDFGYEPFGYHYENDDYPQWNYLLSQRYTANDRDYVPVDEDDDLMYVTEEEYENAKDEIVGQKEQVKDRSRYQVHMGADMSAKELESVWNDVLDHYGVKNEITAVASDPERESGKYLGKIYVNFLAPAGVNLHTSPDFDEESRDMELGPVGAGYKKNKNGDVFYVKEVLEKGNMYLLDNDRYINKSRKYVSFVQW